MIMGPPTPPLIGLEVLNLVERIYVYLKTFLVISSLLLGDFSASNLPLLA